MRSWIVEFGTAAALLVLPLAGCDDGEADKPSSTAGAGGEGHRGDAGSDQGGNAGDGTAGAAGSDESACSAVDPELAEADASELFDYPSLPVFDLSLPEEEWAALQENAVEEEYVPVEACFEGRSIGTVGLRFKGSFGSLYGCFEGGENICRKLGMKLKFNEYDDDLRFFGLKRLNLHGNRYDDTYMHERLSYDLYRAMDIVAPRAGWAEVRVNGELLGLYGMIEQIDGRFTDDRWPDDGDGNLYKEVWPTQTEESALIEDLKTNEEEPDVSALATFAEAMTSADQDELRSTLAEYTDLDYWARYMAVDDAIINNDGITAYYTSDDAAWAGNHNFYLYEEAPDNFTLIPWDLESTLSRVSGYGFVPRWTEVPEDCSETYPVWGGQALVLAPGCDPVFQALAADLESYRDAGERLLDGPFSEESMLEAIDAHAAFIRDAVEADPNGPGLATFDASIAYLKSEIPHLRSRFEYLLTGQPWTPLQLDVDAVTGFEEQDDFGLLEGPSLMANNNSDVSVSVNETEPLVGEHDLRIGFEYRNEEGPWEQWLQYRVPLLGGQHDMRDLTGIRLWVRADQTRLCRFDLASPANSATNQGINMGWDLTVGPEATEVEVLFSEAAVPDWAVLEGRDPGDDPADVLRTVNGVIFFPQAVGRGSSGQLPNETSDEGFLQVDDIEFF